MYIDELEEAIQESSAEQVMVVLMQRRGPDIRFEIDKIEQQGEILYVWTRTDDSGAYTALEEQEEE